MRAARVQAQAKINVFLRIGERQDSGFHEISTLFLRLDHADEIIVRTGGAARTLDCAGAALPTKGLGPADGNLAYRAAAAYAERSSWPRGFAIELTKHIPVGGGLGGGSADAGAVLRALDALAAKPLGPAVLMEVGASLGSDVPFFASDHAAAVGSGRGERLLAVKPYPARDVLLLVPHFGISTTDAYRWLDEDRAAFGTPEERSEDLLPLDTLWSWERLAHSRLDGNDFEPVIERRHPRLKQMRDWLTAQGAQFAHLAGSGSTVFGVFEGRAPDARDLALDASVISTRTSSRVVQVEVLE